MKDLIERLERASRPDRELGNDVLLAYGWICEEHRNGPDSYLTWAPSPDHEDMLDGDQPDPTASLDAALTLVPEGMSWAIKSPGFQSLSKKYRVHLETGDDEWSADGWTAPAAVCIAAFKVRS